MAQTRMATHGARDARMQFAEDLRQHAVLRHRQRQARIAHHQRIEHAKAADHAAQDQADRSSGPPSRPAMSAQEPVSHALDESPVIHMAATGTM